MDSIDILNPSMLDKPKRYIEVPQHIDIKFSFLKQQEKSNSYEIMFPLIKCRDYLGDALFCTKNKQDIDIYGFKFTGSKEQIDLDKVKLFIKFGNSNLKEKFIENIKHLHKIESINKYTQTKCYNTKDISDSLAIVGSKNWLNSIFSLSLYTFLLRVITQVDTTLEDLFNKYLKDTDKRINTMYTEREYIQKIKDVKKLMVVLTNLRKLEYKYISGTSVKVYQYDKGSREEVVDDVYTKDLCSIVHNSSGFVSNLMSNNLFSSYYRDQINNLLKHIKE